MTDYHNLINQLSQAGIDSPRLEARLLLADVLKCDVSSSEIFNTDLTENEKETLSLLIDRRIIKKEPLDKILGYKEFYKYNFSVNHNVLSPRPDTEILLEEAINLASNKKVSVLDLGTGSGCILLSLLKENPKAEGVGVDISEDALQIAQKNAKALNVEKKVKWLNLDWFKSDFLQKINAQFDLIVSNPPYIPDKDIAQLEDEVKLYDPLYALSGGEDGLVSYRRIAELAPFLLKEGGYILLECGIGQAQLVADIFMKNNLSFCKILKDLQNIERCVILKK